MQCVTRFVNGEGVFLWFGVYVIVEISRVEFGFGGVYQWAFQPVL